jgi:hypothetical protein
MVVTTWMAGMTLLALVGPVAAASSRDLDDEGLRQAIAQNHALATYVRRNGMPDLAESRFLSDRPPWDKNEVALFYFDMHKEISFARAVILGDPSIHLERFERRISDAEIDQLRSRARHYGECRTQYASASDPTARAEAAAARAEAAAGRVEAAADAADRAADHAEALAAKAESGFHKSLKK